MKTSSRPGAKTPKPETTKINLSIGVETSKRLFVAAIMSNRTASEIVDELLRAGLKDWALPAPLAGRANSRHSHDSAICSGPVESMLAEVA
jgi:hypothetical protein